MIQAHQTPFEAQHTRIVHSPYFPLLTCGIIVFLFGISIFLGLGKGPLREWDEFLTAERSREIVVSAHLCPLQFNFSPDLNKPPMQYYLTAATLMARNNPVWAARFWSAFFGCGSLILIGIAARKMCPEWPWAMPLSMAFLATVPMFRYFSSTAFLETGALFFLLSTLVFVLLGRTRPSFWIMAGLAAGLGSLQKTPLAFALLIFLAMADSGRRNRFHIVLGCLTGAILTISWPLMLAIKTGPRHLLANLLDQWWNQRFALTRPPLPESCVGVLYADLRHWAPLLAIILAFAIARMVSVRHKNYFILILPVIVYGLILIIMPGRSPRYLLPLIPFLILIALVFLNEIARPYPNRQRLIGGVLLLSLAPLLFVDPLHMVSPYAQALRSSIPAATAFGNEIKTCDTPVFLCSSEALQENMHLAIFLFYGSVNRSFWCFRPADFMRYSKRPQRLLGVASCTDFETLQKSTPGVRAITNIAQVVIWRMGP